MKVNEVHTDHVIAISWSHLAAAAVILLLLAAFGILIWRRHR